MTQPVYEVCIDWDCAEWNGAHDFATSGDDVTSDVKKLRVTRGKDRESNTYPAATLEMTLDNSSGDYYPTNTGGSHYPNVRLWLPVRVRATHNAVTYNIFYGYINRITAYPILNRQEIYFYATDGTDLLAKQIIVQDMDTKVVKTDGEAVNEILNAAGWRYTGVACTMQNAGDTVTKASHGLADGTKIVFSGASLPAAINPEWVYYVISSAENTFQISETSGGAAVEFAGDGSGYYHQVRRAVDVDGGDIMNFPDTFEYEA